MKSIQSRIKELERVIKARNGSLFTVYYKDGSTRRIHPGDSIRLCLDEGDKIKRFEEDPGGSNNGILEGLVNALLLSGEDHEGKEVV